MPFSEVEEAIRKDLPKTTRAIELLILPSYFRNESFSDSGIEQGLKWLFDILQNGPKKPVAIDGESKGHSADTPKGEEPSSSGGFWSAFTLHVLKPLDKFLL
eukprot:Colp12_sorted_trinity150504_noHs@1720